MPAQTDREEASLNDMGHFVLLALLHGPSYGYAIRTAIAKITDGEKKPSLASLYDSLARLLDDGFVERAKDEVVDGRVRRTYRITALGEQALEAKQRTMQQLLAAGQAGLALGQGA